MDALTENWQKDEQLGKVHVKTEDPQELQLFKAKLFHLFRWLLGGDKFYIGRPLEDTHWPLNITDEMFDRANGIVIQTLRSMKPKLPLFRKISKILCDLRPLIVAPPEMRI